MKQRIKDNVATLQTLYETDFYAWAMKTAELIRQGRIHEIAWGQVAEELEDMGRSERREMAARLEKLRGCPGTSYCFRPPLFGNGIQGGVPG
jgi:hypothetical protein